MKSLTELISLDSFSRQHKSKKTQVLYKTRLKEHLSLDNISFPHHLDKHYTELSFVLFFLQVLRAHQVL